MRVRKPQGVYTKSFVFRPGKALHGKFSIGLAIESIGATATSLGFEWCGSKRVLAFGPSRSGFVTNLRLPQNLSEGDVYVLSVSSPAALIISVGLYGDEEALESIAIEELDDAPAVQTVCADPTTPGDRSFQDELAMSNLVIPAQRPAPLGRIESLRPFPEGGILTLTFRRRPKDAVDSNFMIQVTVGESRRPCIMAPWQSEMTTSFRMQPAEAGETWPLTLTANVAFTWSATVHRNFDTIFLPAFSLVI